MKTSFSLLEILHRENPVFITGMGLQCIVKRGGGATSNFNFSESTYFIVLSTLKWQESPDLSWISQSKVDSVKKL